MAKLTELQHKFLNELFGKSCGKLKDAAEAVGVSDYYELMTDELLIEIRKRGDAQLSMSIPKAIHIMNKLLDEPETMLYGDKLHKICADILDRAGLSKVERGSGSSTTIGILILPNKQILEQPENVEVIEQIKHPMLI